MADVIKLPDVTLVMVSSVNIKLCDRAIDKCRSVVNFGDVLFFTDDKSPREYRTIETPKFTSVEACAAYFYTELHKYIKTDFIMVASWDGYIINPDQWNDEFLKYDFIGSRWPWYRDGRAVGNTGFHLQSKKLLEILTRMPVTENFPDDSYICRMLRPYLEKEWGIKFAPEAVADRFAFERSEPTKAFGFHGLFNFPHVMPDEELINILPYFEDYVVAGGAYSELMDIYAKMGKADIVRSMVKNGNRHIQESGKNLRAD